MMDLGEYLKASTGERWATGTRDCCTFPADWAVSWGGGDPMAEWRGLYTTDEEALALVIEAGGLANLWERGTAAIGIGHVETPCAGDIAVIQVIAAGRHPEDVGAIHTGRRWAFRAPAGVVFASAEFVRAWGPR